MKQRIINSLLSFVMVLSMVNSSAAAYLVHAEDIEGTEEPVTEIEPEVTEETVDEEETPEEEEPEVIEETEDPETPAEPEVKEPEEPEITEEPEVTPEPTEEPEIVKEPEEELPEATEEPEETEEPVEEEEEEYEVLADGGDYQVIINANGGTWDPNAEWAQYLYKGNVRMGMSLDVPLSPAEIVEKYGLTRDGYVPLGVSPSKTAETPKYGWTEKANYSSKRGASVTLYVVWQPLSYPIHLHANGGHFGSDESADTLIALKPIVLEWAIPYTVTRANYKFLGWAKTADAEEAEFLPKKKYMTYSEDNTEMDLYAVWSPTQYKVTLKPNGGIMAGDTKTKKSVVKTYSEKDKSLDLTAAGISRKGYNFKGWFKDSKFKNEIKSVDELLETKGKTATLYAKWEAKTYNVTLHVYNGNNFLSAIFGDKVAFKDGTTEYTFQHTYGKAITLKSTGHTPVLSGTINSGDGTEIPVAKLGKFIGWSGDKGTADDAYNNTLKAEFSVSKKYKYFSEDGEDVDLWAILAPITYNLTLKPAGGLLKGQTKVKKTVSTKINMLNTYKVDLEYDAISRNGYIFQGWYTKASGGTEIKYEDLMFNPGKYKTLYAHWQPKTYIVTLDSGLIGKFKDGSQQTTFEHTAGKAKAIKNAPIPDPEYKKYYKFAGWTVGGEKPAVDFKDGTKYKLFTENGDNGTLYAVWTPISYKVTLKPNGGIMAGDAKAKSSVTKSYTIEDPLTIFENGAIKKDGYMFAGWYKNAKFTGESVKPDDIKNNPGTIKTLYAKWEKVQPLP